MHPIAMKMYENSDTYEDDTIFVRGPTKNALIV
jgi:hypothetical protein